MALYKPMFVKLKSINITYYGAISCIKFKTIRSINMEIPAENLFSSGKKILPVTKQIITQLVHV